MLLHVIDAIGTASANLVEFRGIRPQRCTSRIYSDNVTMTLHNMTLTSHKPYNTITSLIAAKQTVINEVYAFQ